MDFAIDRNDLNQLKQPSRFADAGTAIRDLVLQQLTDLGNLMLIESNAHTAFDKICWGIEALNKNGVGGIIICHMNHLWNLIPGPG